MKKLQFVNYSFQNDCYSISLGNDSLHLFNSRKEAKAFLSNASRFFTDKAWSLFELLNRIDFHRRELWLLGIKESRKIQEVARNIEDMISRAFFLSPLVNGPYHSVSKLIKSSRMLYDSASVLMQSEFVKNIDTARRKKLNSLRIQAEREQAEMIRYGIDTAFKINTKSPSVQLILNVA